MKRNLNFYLPQPVRFFLLSLLLLVFINFLFRLTLYFLNSNLAENATTSDIIYSLFNIGFRFDLYISLLILVIPFIIASIPFLTDSKTEPFLKTANWVLLFLVIANMAISISDIGYFRYYNARITKTIFDWTNEPGVMLKIMASDKNYLGLFGVFVLLVVIYIFVQQKILKMVLSPQSKHYKLPYRIGLFITMLALIFFTMRGSFNFNKAPLNIDDAFFSENLFLNQLSLNPVYNLAHSYSDFDVNYFNDDSYLNTALDFLNRSKGNGKNPFEIQVQGTDSLQPNIILIFLESMSNSMVSRYNPTLQTTPYLDSLALGGIVFDNFYSAGVHTHNALTSTFYGLPAVMNNKPMSEFSTASMYFHGMPWILKEKGYYNSFYVTGSKKFDNMVDFFSVNGFDEIIGESDYPPADIYNSWGVTDETMFNRVLNECDELHKAGKKFFKSVLTISAHEGYTIPQWYKKQLINNEHPYDLYEFSDLMLGEFMNEAKTKDWFDETVFVIVGDHGQNFSTVYDLNLNYHRVPLIIYAPWLIDHSVYADPGLQMDIYPSLFGLIGMPYTNNGLGVDLFSQKRPYAYFSADTKLGVIDEDYFLIYRDRNKISLFATEDNSLTNVYSQNQARADDMLRYGFSMMQSAKYLIDNKLTNITESNKYAVDRFIAHAGGVVDGEVYTNSLEALNASYAKGFRLFELDILETSDGHFVAVHDWERWQQMTAYEGLIPPSRSNFKNHRLLSKYTPLDMDDINEWFRTHPDAILVTDKVNKPQKFSDVFLFPERLMMELFSIEALKEAVGLKIRSAMPTWDMLEELKGDKIKTLTKMGITDIAASRTIIADNIPTLMRLKNRGIRVYAFHINYDEGVDETYVLCNELDYLYGMYADDFDFSKNVDCP